MSEKAQREFHDKAEAVINAFKEYAEGMERGDWFQRGLDNKLRQSVDELLEWPGHQDTRGT